ncbi:hypothetical protein [Lysinibacillus capsici]|uniref:hypothetical protein n=1 Tax=Lysinibacillus capsici TaxID=2115968 RepID=UPI000E20B725|nr:hypothetical protein [Lysinibacillus capsici]RDV27778.1 hypothetical protein C7B89_19565 [Lysinibacillus capsici]
MAEFYIEANGLARTMERSIDATARGMLNGLTDVKNDWKAESIDIAPIDTSNLRQQIAAEVFTEGNEKGVEISANATRGARRFNYAYYIHEEDAGGANVNGEKKFLDKPAQNNKEKWAEWIEREIESELRRAGW